MRKKKSNVIDLNEERKRKLRSKTVVGRQVKKLPLSQRKEEGPSRFMGYLQFLLFIGFLMFAMRYCS